MIMECRKKCYNGNIMRTHKKMYLLIAGLAGVVAVLFVIVFMQLGVLDSHVKNLESNFQIALQSGLSTSTAPIAISSSTGTSTPPVTEEGNGTVIPTSIAFVATSSSALQPQAPITFTVQDVTQEPDGKIFVHVSASTDQAQSYSAIDPTQFFGIANLNGPSKQPDAVDGAWSSMPPQTTVQGTVMFQLDPSQTSIILQVGDGSGMTFYQFDFQAKTYKSIVLG